MTRKCAGNYPCKATPAIQGHPLAPASWHGTMERPLVLVLCMVPPVLRAQHTVYCVLTTLLIPLCLSLDLYAYKLVSTRRALEKTFATNRKSSSRPGIGYCSSFPWFPLTSTIFFGVGGHTGLSPRWLFLLIWCKECSTAYAVFHFFIFLSLDGGGSFGACTE